VKLQEEEAGILWSSLSHEAIEERAGREARKKRDVITSATVAASG
jgi:hypothetical protein